MRNGSFIDLKDLWQFAQDEGIGVGHVAKMKERARNRSFIVGKILLSDLSHVIGDPELEAEFLSRISTGRYRRASQVGTCGTGVCES
ncbi:MAG TPA: hypothetical protein VMH91_02190 [Candidatus Paceibacterota bacterium]|nr:hypothetical protein [Candidatus Paceibacterota bacterium]